MVSISTDTVCEEQGVVQLLQVLLLEFPALRESFLIQVAGECAHTVSNCFTASTSDCFRNSRRLQWAVPPNLLRKAYATLNLNIEEAQQWVTAHCFTELRPEGTG